MLASRYLAAPITDRVLALLGHDVSSPSPTRTQVTIGVLVEPQGRAKPEAKRLSKDDVDAANPSTADDVHPSVIQWTSTAAVLYLLSGGLGVWGMRRQARAVASLEQQRTLAQAQAQRREAEMRLSVLAAQVEPHFLFNTLAGVRSAIHCDPDRASTMVDRLVDYLRAAIPRLRSDGTAEATLGAQIDIVRAYLALMTSRLPRLSFDIQVDPSLLPLPFPPLMLITLAENAVKHGIEPKLGPARIVVTAEQTADRRLSVTVTDDGVGFGAADTSGSGIGLANLRERLAQMYGAGAELRLKAGAEGGVAATIAVPTPA
jgi:LytS/YehU family sensor histidine kinase